MLSSANVLENEEIGAIWSSSLLAVLLSSTEHTVDLSGVSLIRSDRSSDRLLFNLGPETAEHLHLALFFLWLQLKPPAVLLTLCMYMTNQEKPYQFGGPATLPNESTCPEEARLSSSKVR